MFSSKPQLMISYLLTMFLFLIVSKLMHFRSCVITNDSANELTNRCLTCEPTILSGFCRMSMNGEMNGEINMNGEIKTESSSISGLAWLRTIRYVYSDSKRFYGC